MSVFASIFRRPTRLPIVMSALVTVALIYAGLNVAGIVNRPKTTEDVAAIADAAIVKVCVKTPEEHDAAGTGFFFTERGDIMTVFHLANQGDKRIKVQFKDGKTLVEKPATIAVADEKYDFTVLHVDGVNRHRAPRDPRPKMAYTCLPWQCPSAVAVSGECLSQAVAACAG